ncbi:MAG: arsenite S-adenosylmethyltransferase, partial [Gemmatimonadetes bacterium]
MGDDEIKQAVKQKYGQAALRVVSGERGSCGETGSCSCDPVSS